MKIISFAWTTPEFKAGKKTVTRRDWNDKYAKQFKVGDLVQAYDKSPRIGGKQTGVVRIKNIRLETLRSLTDHLGYGFDEIAKEGGLWKSPSEFVETFKSRRTDGKVWRIEFEVVDG